MNDIGYSVIEPPSLEEWLCKIKNRGMLVALLTWVQHRLSHALHDEFPSLQIEVIKVQYMGKYPALGIHGDFPNELLERVNIMTEQILSNSPVNDFLNFALDDKIDWDARAQTLLSP